MVLLSTNPHNLFSSDSTWTHTDITSRHTDTGTHDHSCRAWHHHTRLRHKCVAMTASYSSVYKEEHAEIFFKFTVYVGRGIIHVMINTLSLWGPVGTQTYPGSVGVLGQEIQVDTS